ncbi:uncharacterized protein LOC116188501 isoform X2 [Punica granatum]|uniref:Uncharacterized protein LOC116188501 isoform X2 n=1 Tax=Punica granatum TaxID=22663 RepID=A0A6P8BU74_PUNGR|nr:uncharacterized protein LOC116188501 isoform X2 [Punica granatum]
MADKPSRALVLFGDGLAPLIGPEHTHLHSVASKAVCGFLSLPNAPPSESEDERIVREFALLLDALDAYPISGNEGQPERPSIPPMGERFTSMKAGLVTDHAGLISFAKKLGLLVGGLTKGSNGLLGTLGFGDDKTYEKNLDVVFVHTGADSDTHLSVLRPKSEEESNLSKLFPRQSYTMRGEHPRDNVRHHCPMLIAQWQNAVTRRDTVETFSFEDFKERGANLVIPADRFVHEVAFKVWKAPKYGA